MKKSSKTPMILFVSSLVIALTALIMVLVLFLHNGDGTEVEKGDVVVTIDGTKIYENQFFFCASLLLEQEDASYHYDGNIPAVQLSETLKSNTLNFIKEYIYRLREAKQAGITLSDEDVKALDETIKNEYESRKKVGVRVLEGDEFYNHYYGLSEKQYVQFWQDWAVIEKYNARCEETADVSLSNQERAYEEYEDYLKGCNATVLSLSVTNMTTDEIATKRQLANDLASQIRQGADMVTLIQKHCDDEALVAAKGSVHITKAVGTIYTELYNWTLKTDTGDISVIETRDAIYVVRADSFTNFNTLKDTDKMKEWTRLFAVNEQTAQLLQSKKYKVTVNTEVYTTLDLSSMLENGAK